MKLPAAKSIIAITPGAAENGCPYYLSCSHKWGLPPITGLAGDMDAVRQVLTGDRFEGFDNKIANELPRGYASFHHLLMMHGSYANYSERRGRTVVCQ